MWRLLPYALAILAFCAFVGMIYAKGHADAANAARIAGLEHSIDVLNQIRKKQHEVAQADQAQAAIDHEIITDLETLLQEAANAVVKPDDVCLDSTDVDALIKLWPKPRGK